MHYPAHRAEEEEKVGPVGGLADEEEEACQEGKAFSALVTSDLREEEEETSTLGHKEVVTFYPKVAEVVCRKEEVTECPWGEEGAHATPWVLVVDQDPP
jgi:hypothetical protein